MQKNNKKISFILDYKITGKDSTNAIYASKNPWARSKYAQDVKDFIRWHLISQKINKQKNDDKTFTVKFAFPPDRLDIDNHSYFAKCVIDACKGWIIKDDKAKYIQGITLAFDTTISSILVEFTEAGEGKK
jgi:hypothetical protein